MPYRSEPTSALRVGDLVLNHGMHLRINEPLTVAEGHHRGPVYFGWATCENVEHIETTDPWLARMMRAEAKRHGHEAPGWQIQGNDLAQWAVVIEAVNA